MERRRRGIASDRLKRRRKRKKFFLCSWLVVHGVSCERLGFAGLKYEWREREGEDKWIEKVAEGPENEAKCKKMEEEQQECCEWRYTKGEDKIIESDAKFIVRVRV